MRVIALVMMLPFAVSAQSALPADVRAACDGAFAIVSKSQGIKTRRANGSFNDETFRAPIPGCRIEIDGSFKKAGKAGVAADNLHTNWMSTGWQELGEFSADGPDGTSYAFKKGTAACF